MGADLIPRPRLPLPDSRKFASESWIPVPIDMPVDAVSAGPALRRETITSD